MQEPEKKPLEQVEEHILTEKQQRFCDFYIETGNGTEAALRAGYGKKAAYKIASVNLRKPYIKAYIDKRLKEMADARIADAKEVREYLTKVMRREHMENIVVTTTEEISTYAPDAQGKMRKQTVKHEIPKIVEIPAKLADSNKAAELMGKTFGLFIDKTQFDGALPVIICGDDQLEE